MHGVTMKFIENRYQQQPADTAKYRDSLSVLKCFVYFKYI